MRRTLVATPKRERGVKRVLILNSYSLTDRPAEHQVRVQSFLDGLTAYGYRQYDNLQVEIIDSNDLEQLESSAIEALGRSPDLIHAVGTPNAIIASRISDDLPIVYYGAHPEGAGEASCRKANIAGVVLTLPLATNYKTFRFLRTLLPQVRRVYVPFFEGTVFCQPAMKAKHVEFRSARSRSPWVSGGSDYVGYRSLAGLCYVVGVDYRELVYRDLDDLRHSLTYVDPARSMIMPHNDSVYCRDAPQLLTQFALDAKIPLVWNNNPEATRIGALAAFAGCFRQAGLVAGRQAAAILRGATARDIGLCPSTEQHASINLDRARALGLSVADDLLGAFDEVISDAAKSRPAPLGMTADSGGRAWPQTGRPVTGPLSRPSG